MSAGPVLARAGADVDVAILGGGCAGLSLAFRLAGKGLRVHIVEPRETYVEDRSWSFWRTGPDPFEDCVRARWSSWQVARGARTVVRRSRALRYETVSAERFYARTLAACELDPDTKLCCGTRASGDPSPVDGHWRVDTTRGSFTARYVVDTRPSAGMPDYAQFFVGREVRAERPVFDPTTAGIMEFAEPCEGHDRIDFTYVLPFDERTALIETTSFAAAPPPERELLAWLEREIERRAGGTPFETLRTERGLIPMQASHGRPETLGPGHAFGGLRGGGARPSTGYAFQRIQTMSERTARRILAGAPNIATCLDGPGTRFMDRLFLDVLRRAPERGPALFMALFESVPGDRLERFLSGSTAVIDRAGVAAALPVRPFLRELVRP